MHSWLLHTILLAHLAAPAPYPFAVGETLRYEARLGMLPIGGATTAVARIATERGRPTYVLTMSGQGGPRGLRASYRMTSWAETAALTSRRFHRTVQRGGGTEEERYIIVPDSGRYRREGESTDWVTPAEPLDELAFLYYLRTVRLEPGRAYALRRYFMTGWNPVRVQAGADDEWVTLGDGERVRCQPIRVTAAGATTELWLTADARRLPAMLRLPLPVGRVTLLLASAP